jgi:hypothetical protein
LDGNHQCNQFNKNTDPDDVSLCAGKAYFPDDAEYRDYLKRNPVLREVSVFTPISVRYLKEKSIEVDMQLSQGRKQAGQEEV